MRALVCLFALILSALMLSALSAAAQDKQEVDLALALGIDISGSIDPDEARLQREGYVNAFRDPVIVKAILGGANGRIAVSYFEWSDSWMQKLLIDWTLLDSEVAIANFAHRLQDAPISIARRTSISGAVENQPIARLPNRRLDDIPDPHVTIAGPGEVDCNGLLVLVARLSQRREGLRQLALKLGIVQ